MPARTSTVLARTAVVTGVGIWIALGAVAAQSRPAYIVGWKERVRIPAYGVTLEATNDTGAQSSSLHAEDIRSFEKDGEAWVRFELVTRDGEDGESDDDGDGDNHTLQASALVVDDVLIKRKRGEALRRHVIRLGLCMGHIYREVEVNLADRSGYSTRLLVGRDFLEGRALVDSDVTFTQEPACPPDGS